MQNDHFLKNGPYRPEDVPPNPPGPSNQPSSAPLQDSPYPPENYPPQGSPYPPRNHPPQGQPYSPGYPPQGSPYPPENYPPQGSPYPPENYPPQGSPYPPENYPPQGHPHPPGNYPPYGFQVPPGQAPHFVPPRLDDPFLIFKKGIRRDLMIILLVVAAYYLAQTIFSGIFIMLQMLAGGGFSAIMNSAMSNIDPSTGQLDMEQYLNESMSVFGSMGSIPGGLALTQLLAVVFAFPLFFIVAGKRWFSEYVPRVNRPMKGRIFLQIFVIAMSAQLVFTVLSILFDLLLGLFGYSVSGSYEATMNMMKTPIGYAYIMVIGPISEELIFRGAIMRRLERHGANFAIVISALIFGLFHMILIQSMFAFIVGLVLGYTAQRYSLKWAILLHILINSTSSLMDMIPGDATATMLIMIGFFVGALIICITRRMYIREEIREGHLPGFPAPGGSPYRIAFSSVFLILYMILTVLIGITMILGTGAMTLPGT